VLAAAAAGVIAACIGAACTGPAPVPGGAYASPAAAGSRAGGAGSPGSTGSGASPSAPPAALTAAPSPGAQVISATAPADVTARLAAALFRSAPVVVVAAPDDAAVAAAARQARVVRAPLLLAPGTANRPSLVALGSAVAALHPSAVLAVSLPRAEQAALAARLPGVLVTAAAAGLPATGSPAPGRSVAVLVAVPASRLAAAGTAETARTAETAETAGTAQAAGTAGTTVAAVTATAAAAGAGVVSVHGFDPRADPAAVTALARLRPAAVIAVGAGFGPAARLASRVTVTETGRQLPGGGQVLFPGRRLVALYGHPGTPGLGVLGQQDLTASIARARQLAAAYQPLSGVPVIPAFEIIATVAEASPGPDGSFSYQTPAAELLPWVRQATADGLYVVLDLQPGRASVLAQAERYQALLGLPDVGLAIDPEWKLQPGQRPLRQIGHVDVSEVNAVVSWLAGLTARDRLPQKLLVLHQFKLTMINGEQRLDTSQDDLAVVVHMDGQGTPAVKQATWNAVTAAAPPGVYFGWKNFLVKDHPTLTPEQTMTKSPVPVMISYQ
jgi:hypothetical protein